LKNLACPRAAEELDELEEYAPEAVGFAWLGIDAEQYCRALYEAWDKVRDNHALRLGSGTCHTDRTRQLFPSRS
jgi:hypothetical protein